MSYDEIVHIGLNPSREAHKSTSKITSGQAFNALSGSSSGIPPLRYLLVQSVGVSIRNRSETITIIGRRCGQQQGLNTNRSSLWKPLLPKVG